MGSKFLGNDSNNLLALQDGTFNLNVSSADVQSLVPSMPVCSSATRSLVSRLIETTDCNFSVLTNPLTGNLNANNNSIEGISQMFFNPNGDPLTPVTGITLYSNGTDLKFISPDNSLTVATTNDLATYLLKSGGTMTGSIDMGGQEIKNCGAFRIATSAMKTIIGSTSTAAAGNFCTVVGGVSTMDVSSISSSALGYGNTVATSIAAALLGTTNTATGSSNCVLIGQSNTATNAIGSIAIGQNSASTANAAHCLGSNLANSVANSTVIDSSVNIRSSSTTCDLGTTALPFRNLYINNFALSSNPSNRIPSSRFAITDAYGQLMFTTVETSLITSSNIGSLVIPGPTTPGFTLNFTMTWLYQSGAATDFTLRFKVNGVAVLTTIVPAAVFVNQTTKCTHSLQLWTPASGTRIYIASSIDRHLAVSILNEAIADNVWDPNGNNTISFTGQFSDTNGICAPRYAELTTSYAS